MVSDIFISYIKKTTLSADDPRSRPLPISQHCAKSFPNISYNPPKYGAEGGVVLIRTE